MLNTAGRIVGFFVFSSSAGEDSPFSIEFLYENRPGSSVTTP